ncbi:MAG: glycosyltransferase family 2 protein [Gammaproteobacteria bacterium]|nr:MAG: glycosyltransferase family 2 protein [Gammaproteobacteria bacterium]
MNSFSKNPSSSVIISVYTDHVALEIILDCLNKQTVDNFEIIVSEDGEDSNIKKVTEAFTPKTATVKHLTQEDSGFRKNIALNRAISAANTEHLIFIDGDCLPHPGFITSHQAYAKQGVACTGRRLELGKQISTKIRKKNITLKQLTTRFLYFINIYPLLRDGAKNIECGIYSRLLQRITRNREIRLLGCNFSCNKQDLIKINGFNEEYLSPGIGEDSDIDWRLIKSGVKIKNVKFSAIQYHLHHPRSYIVSGDSQALFAKTRLSDSYICQKGIQHLNI